MHPRRVVESLVSSAVLTLLLTVPARTHGQGGALEDPPLEYNVAGPLDPATEACESDLDAAAPGEDIAGFLRVQPSVGRSGDAQVTVPIEIPPGRIAPSLALVYSSHAGYSHVGKGWSLAGLPKIHRCAATMAIDGEVRAVRLDGDDRICLNGQRLIEVAAFGSNVEFRFEEDSLVRVIGRRVGSDYAQFVVYQPSGEYAVYGATSQGQQILGGVVYAWFVEEVFDRHQNSYRVTYDHLGVGSQAQEVVPNQITYAHHPQQSTPGKTIAFDYTQPLAEPSDYFVAGHRMTQSRRLSRIDVFLGSNKLVKRYQLDQTPAGSGMAPTLLDRVTVCEGDGMGPGIGACLMGTEFTYTPDDGGLGAPTPIGTDNIPIWYKNYFLSDLDGDGRDDLVFVAGLQKDRDVEPNGTPAWDADFGRYGLFVRYTQVDPIDPTNTFWSEPIRIMTDQPPCEDCEDPKPIEARPVDANRDGVAELAVRFWRAPRKPKIHKHHRGWVLYSYPGYPQGQGWPSSNWFAESRNNDHFQDADGDSLPDLFHCDAVDDDEFEGTYQIIFQGGGAIATDVPCLENGVPSDVLLIDLDGDGAVELMHTNGSGTTLAYDFANRPTQYEFDAAGAIVVTDGPDTRRHPKVGDFNGDGLMDAIYEKNGNVEMRFSTGAHGFIATSWQETGLSDALVHPRPGGLVDPTRAVDLNNDGRSDLLTFTTSGPTTYFSKSDIWLSNQFTAPVTPPGLTGYHEEVFVVGDFTGDGTPDPVQINTGSDTWDAFFQTTRPHLLSTIVEQPSDSLTYAFDYLALSQSIPGHVDNDVYEVNCSPMATFPVHCLLGGNMYVVRKMRRDVGRRDDQSDYPMGVIKYRYRNGRFGVTGRGFMGFEVVEVSDGITPIERETIYDYTGYDVSHDRFPYSDRVRMESTTVTVQDTLGQVTRHDNVTVRTHASIPTVPGFGRIHRPVMATESVQRRITEPFVAELILETGTEYTDFDDLGFPRLVRTMYPDGNTLELTSRHFHKRVPSSSPVPAHNVWLIGLHVAQENRWAGTTGSRVNYELRGYDYTTGDPLWSEVGMGGLVVDAATNLVPATVDPLRLRTDLGYDAYGNLTSSVVSNPGSSSPSSRASLAVHSDPEHMYPTVLTDPMNHERRQGYHPAFGEVCWEQGLSGQVARRTFDRLGRLREVEDPSQNRATHGYEWNVVGGQIDGAHPYFTSSTEVGKPARRSLVDRLGREVLVQKESFDCAWVERVKAYDNRGRVLLESVTYPDGQAPAYADLNGWSFAYDLLGRPIARRAPDENTASTADDAQGTTNHSLWIENGAVMGTRVIEVNPRGKATHQFIDRMGRVARMRDALGNVTHYAYGPTGDLTRVEDSLGTVTRIAFDDLGRRIAIDDPSTGIERYTYTAFGEIETVTDATGNVVTFTYDALGRVTSRSDSVLSAASTWTYDDPATNGKGLLHSARGADGHTRTFTYDPIQRVQTETLEVDGTAYPHRYIYRSDGLLAAHVFPDALDGTPFAIELAYAANGQIESIHDALDDTTPKRTFWRREATDLDGRTTSERLGEQGLEVVSDYGFWGGLQGRSATEPGGGMLLSRTFDYDQQRNLIGRTDALQGWQEVYGYDDLDRLTLWASQPGMAPVLPTSPAPPGTTLTNWTTATRLQAQSRMTTMDSSGPTTCGPSYLPLTLSDPPADPWSPLVAEDMRATASLAVPIDDDGEPIGTMPHVFCAGGGYASCVEIGYDARGNILQKSGVGVYGYGALVTQGSAPTFPGDSSAPPWRHIPDALTGIGIPNPENYVYDAGGRLISSPDYDITWTPWARPRRIMSSKWDTSYAYDADGLRVLKERSTLVGGIPASSPGGYSTERVVSVGDYEHRTTTSFQGDGLTGIAAEHATSHYFITVDGRAVAHVIHYEDEPTVGDTGEAQASALGQSPSQGLVDASDELANAIGNVDLRALANKRTLRYFIRGVSQSPALVVTEAGELIEEHRYDPFGAEVPVSLDPDGAERVRIHPGFRGYTNHDSDTELGLVDMNGRIYAPHLGRFLSPDPYVTGSFNSQSLNRYAYVLNNPAKYEDPTGFEPGTIFLALMYYHLYQRGLLDEHFDAVIPLAAGVLGGYDIVFDLVELYRGKTIFGNDANRWITLASIAIPVVSSGLIKLAFRSFGFDLAVDVAGDAVEFEVKAYKGTGRAAEAGADTADASARAGSPPGGCRGCGTPAVCFLAGTLVATPSGSRRIEDLRVGDRVSTFQGGRESRVDETWRVIDLILRDRLDPRDVYEITLLRPQAWLLDRGVEGVGELVRIEADDAGVSGWATIVDISPAPPPVGGSGRVVLATITHYNDDLYRLSFGAGMSRLYPTGRHRLFSLDRGDWVRVARLFVGERLQTSDGVARIESIQHEPGSHRVFNIEVEGDHEFLVGDLRLRAHNMDCPVGADDAVRSGLVEQGSELHDLLTIIEDTYVNTAPRTGEEATDVVLDALRELDNNWRLDYGDNVQQLSNGVLYDMLGYTKTFIGDTGEILIRKQDEIILHILPD